VLDGLSPEKKGDVKTKQLEALKRLGHRDLQLDEYESVSSPRHCTTILKAHALCQKLSQMKSYTPMIYMFTSMVSIHITLHIYPQTCLTSTCLNASDIGGLDPIISSLRESIIYPLLYPNLFSSTSSLLSAPKGVLLFGPPGCGKTMLAKALAKESGATFINIAASVLTNKWYGESNKLVAGLFSLARKTQPSIIFIDEIDSFLRERTKGDHEVTGMMKAEFMT
jgi:hypothetical protein